MKRFTVAGVLVAGAASAADAPKPVAPPPSEKPATDANSDAATKVELADGKILLLTKAEKGFRVSWDGGGTFSPASTENYTVKFGGTLRVKPGADKGTFEVCRVPAVTDDMARTLKSIPTCPK
jgi:hypothetical protein